MIDRRRRGLMGGFCQRLITAVCFTHKRDRQRVRNRESEGDMHAHLIRCTVMHPCIYFQLKSLLASFMSYVTHMEKGRLQSPSCKFPSAQTIHRSLTPLCTPDDKLRCKVTHARTRTHVHTHTDLLNIHRSEFGVMNGSQQ